jgi:hypothetical protein
MANHRMRQTVGRVWLAQAVLCVGLLGIAASVAAEPVPLDNADLAEVVGREGISLYLHLEVNSADTATPYSGARFTRSFNVNGITTYAAAQGLRGTLDLMGVTVDVSARPDQPGGSYLDIGLPGLVAANQFGFRAFGVQTDPQAAVLPEQSMGGVLLHGVGTQTGRFLMWAQ